MRRLRVCVVLVLMASFHCLKAQETATQQTNPPSLKFYQINTDHFRILYPTGFETQAQRMANTMEQIRTPEAASMGVQPRKISIILQNQSAISNGFVALAPRRSEFYAMPSQDYNFVGNNDWLNLLASHEYRHIVQYQRSITGFNKAFYYLFGQQALSGMANAAAPLWFWEGDAVSTETAFTHAGRGRIPNFNLVMRTNLLEGRTFNYHKQYLQSYKNNIPNYYVLGYDMVSYLRVKTGDPNIWERIARRAWNIPFIPMTFSIAVKKETGLYVNRLYKEMAGELTTQWKKELEGLPITTFDRVTQRKGKAYTDYKYPQVLEDGSIVAQKSGIGDIEQIVRIVNGVERGKYIQGPVNETAMMSAARSSVVWNEYRYDPRWLVRTYSIVKRYDFKSKIATVLSRNSRYASAALSPDGLQLATVETGTDYQTRLIIIQGFGGQVLKQFPNPENNFISMPRWTSDGKSIVALKTNKTGKTISLFDVSTGASTDLLPFSDENMGYPVPYSKYVLYNSPYSGIDNIYALDRETGKRYQVTCSKYGAYNPAVSPNGKLIYYNDQSRDGLDVVKIPFDPGRWRPLEEVRRPESPVYQQLANQEQHPGLLDQVPTKSFSTKRYHRAQGMINVHSWGPYFTSSLTQGNIGIYSQDILSTTSVNAGYLYDINEKTGSWQATANYQGQYPILSVTVSEANRSVNEGNIQYNQVAGKDTVLLANNLNFKWKEKTLQAGISVPLITTTSKYVGSLTFSDYIGYSAVSQFRNNIDGGGRLLPANYPQYFFSDLSDHGHLAYNHFSFSGYRLLKQSRRDINSKWGQALYVDLFGTPFGGNYSGAQVSVYGLAFFPGLFKHHSLWGYYAYQNTQLDGIVVNTGQGLDSYTFRNQIPVPRGQTITRFQNFYSMSANYTLPLWYPDIALGPFLNIQRVRANAFFDYGYGNSTYFAGTGSQRSVNAAYSSVGGEVKFDINVMRLLQQFNIGFRFSQGLTPSVSKFELLIGTINF